MRWLAYGIDPGKTGAVAVLSNCRFVLGELADTSSPDEVKRLLLKVWSMDWWMNGFGGDFSGTDEICGIELVGASPRREGGVVVGKMGAATSFRFGRAVGTAHGVAGALGLPILEISPQEWYKLALKGKARPKEKAEKKRAVLAAARQLWPLAPLARVKDGAIADALWIALAAAARMGWVEK